MNGQKLKQIELLDWAALADGQWVSCDSLDIEINWPLKYGLHWLSF